MDVTLLGTGASDGWPNAWCRCQSCLDARRNGIIRTNNAALVDRRLLLDCGPEAPRQAQRAGFDLVDVRTVLVTHAHDDHLDPAFLMHRGWVSDRPLRVVGPAPVIERCRDWLAPEQRVVTLQTITAGDSLELDGYRILALPASHHALGEALLYAVRGSDASILYGTDTGPWQPRVLELLSGWRFDLVMLEETFGDVTPESDGHHNLTSFAQALSDLRDINAIDSATRVLAVHLGHNNPPLAELTDRLAAVGAGSVPDLTTLRIGPDPRTARP